MSKDLFQNYNKDTEIASFDIALVFLYWYFSTSEWFNRINTPDDRCMFKIYSKNNRTTSMDIHS